MLIQKVYDIIQDLNNNVISFSRDVSYCSNYPEGFDNDSIIQKKQKFIRIVRNEEERGISIELRGKKNTKPLKEKEVEISIPLVD